MSDKMASRVLHTDTFYITTGDSVSKAKQRVLPVCHVEHIVVEPSTQTSCETTPSHRVWPLAIGNCVPVPISIPHKVHELSSHQVLLELFNKVCGGLGSEWVCWKNFAETALTFWITADSNKS
eukprot:m.1643684 g.1643684  ORF g.1643684 m.1643684 type:complete len:123 (+) comp59623_c0_seq1:207-575(+)